MTKLTAPSAQGWVWLGALAALANAVLRVAIIPIFVAPIFDKVLSGQDAEALETLLITGASVIAAGALALFGQDAAMGRAAANVSASWRERIYAHLLRATTLPGTSGGLSGRILTDLKDVELYYQFGLGSLIAETLTVVGIIGVLTYYNLGATLWLLALSLPLLAVMSLSGRKLERVTAEAQAATEETGSHIQEGLKHQRVVRVFAAYDFMLQRFGRSNRKARASSTRRSLWAAIQTPVAQIMIFVALGALVTLLVQSVARGDMSLGELVAYLTLVALISTPAQLLLRAYTLWRQARSARERLGHLLATPTSHFQSGGGTHITKPVLELQNLSFAYPEQPSILSNLDIAFPDRGLVALTGPSGSGKTSLLLLLLRLLEPDAGIIFLGGQRLHALSESELRRRIAYVPQGAELISGPVRDVLTLGRAYTDEQLWQVLASVSLANDIKRLPNGLDFELGEDGQGLSGGQAQRLAVARALLSDPELLILDEPSSGLDDDNERALVKTLKHQAANRLVLCVAHRPALAEAADLVLGLEPEGSLVVLAPSEAAT